LGNFQQESRFSPTNAQQIAGKYSKPDDSSDYVYRVNDSVGWGIAQWTEESRKQNLLNYAIEKGTGVGDMNTQLEFVCKELNENSKYYMFDKIKQSDDIEKITEMFMMRYENPDDKSQAAIDARIKNAKNIYSELGQGQ
jgi:hypothetical protein